MRGPTGLNPRDVIDGVNFCSVMNADEWKECLIANIATSQRGFCIPEKIIYSHDETIYHCKFEFFF